MIRFFKSHQPASLILISVIIIGFWARIFFHASPATDPDALPFWKAIVSILVAIPSWINFLLLMGIICGQAVYLNQMLNRHEVLYKNTYLPSFLFALIISGNPSMMQFHPVYITTLFVIIILDRAFALFKNDQPVSALFDSGFLSGLAALISFPGIIIFPFFMVSLIILRPFRLKEWLITIIGFFLPFFFWSTYLFWNHSLFEFWHFYFRLFGKIHPEWVGQYNPATILFAVYIGILLLLSLIKLRANYRKNIIRSRSYQVILFILLLFGIAWICLSGELQPVDFVFLIIPVSVFCAYYFVAARKRMQLYEYALWALIVLIIWNQVV